jgi:hypothetical protein
VLFLERALAGSNFAYFLLLFRHDN